MKDTQGGFFVERVLSRLAALTGSLAGARSRGPGLL